MKKIKMKLLFELLKDSSRSDRKLGKILGASQPTVSRTRNKLVKDGVIQQFTIIPDLTKMGCEIIAFTLLKFSARTPELLEKEENGLRSSQI